MKYLTFSALVLVPYIGFCQQVEEKLIIADAGDSVMLRAFRCAFDTSSNYYFETLQKGKGEKFTLLSNKQKYNTVFWGQSLALQKYKAMISDAFFLDSTRKKLYYKNKNGTQVYGPYPGRIREVLEYGRENIAIELCVGGISNLYINDSLVNSIDSAKQKWLCYFSDNGKILYSVFKMGMFRLYLNHVQIDSSNQPFTDIAVNDNGKYLYVKQVNGKYTISVSGSAYGPFSSVDYSDLLNSDAWYARGCADSMCYVLVNGKLFEKIPEAHSLTEDPNTGELIYKSDEQITVVPLNSVDFLFTYNKSGDSHTYLNHNGSITNFNYSMIGFIFTDKDGKFAFYGARNDTSGAERYYRNINGTEKRIPYLRKRVRNKLHCLQIAPSGTSTYYYETPDSVYLFRNDTLLGKPSQRKKFLTWDMTSFPQYHPDGTEYFTGINTEEGSYILYNNTISRLLPVINPLYDRFDIQEKGSIVAGDVNVNGYFAAITNGKSKVLVVINNSVYKEFEGIDRIFGELSYFDEHSLILYGTKGKSYYQFTIRY